MIISTISIIGVVVIISQGVLMLKRGRCYVIVWRRIVSACHCIVWTSHTICVVFVIKIVIIHVDVHDVRVANIHH